MTPRVKTETPERVFQAQVIALAEQKGWRVAHFHTTQRKVRRKDGSYAYIGDRQAAGFPDLVLVQKDRLIFAELKREKGKLTDAQKEWRDALERPLGEVYVWRPSDWPEIERKLKYDSRF